MSVDTSQQQQPRTCFFNQIDEKHVNQEVKLMLWNPKMDLIAIAFQNGDVHLYRMSWQKVWSVNNTQANVAISSMSWRPDGRILAVSYTNGHLKLLGVEDAKKIFSFQCNEAIQCLYWLQEDQSLADKHETQNFYEDLSSRLLPKPITYDVIYHLFEKTTNHEFPDNLYLKDIKNLTYLICTHGTSIAIFVYGYFLLIDVNLTDLLQYSIQLQQQLLGSNFSYKQLKSCYLSDNCSILCAMGTCATNVDETSLVYSLFDAGILNENNVQIKLISSKFGILFSMLTALKTCIKEMEELWEDILVEMDQKFQLYALEKYNRRSATDQVAGGEQQTKVKHLEPNASTDGSSLVHDFIQLYALGSCSDHFKTFLIHELTEKGLKKLEASVENYYSNIQRLLSGNFQQISLCIFYHLNELLGMSKWFDKFSIFSLTESRVNEVLNNCASLILKAEELNFVIEQNMKEIKLFFKWLHASIIHLTDDQAVTEMTRLNEEMENLILDFINNTFKDDQTINLEKVGQYLKQENLKLLVTEENDWQLFVKQKLSPKESQQLYPVKREKSLLGCFDEFKQSLNDCFKCQAISTTQPFKFMRQYNIHQFPKNQDVNDVIISYKCFDDCVITGLLLKKPTSDCYVLKHQIGKDSDVKASIVSFSSQVIDMSQLNLQDIYVYSQQSLTLLGADNDDKTTYLIQLDIESSSPTSSEMITDTVIDNELYRQQARRCSEPIKAEKVVTNAIIKCLSNSKSVSLYASNSRKVAALLLANKKRVKIFDLEVDEDDDEQNDTENTTYESATNNSINEAALAPAADTMTDTSVVTDQQPQSLSAITPINNIKLQKSAGFASATVTPVNTDLERHLQQQQFDRMRGKRKNFAEDDDDTIDFNATATTTAVGDSSIIGGEIPQQNPAASSSTMDFTNS